MCEQDWWRLALYSFSPFLFYFILSSLCLIDELLYFYVVKFVYLFLLHSLMYVCQPILSLIFLS